MDYSEHVEFIKRWFGDRTDKSGVPSWEHSLNVAHTLEEYFTQYDEVPVNMREDMLLGALGHDLLEDTKVTKKAIRTRWNSNVLSYIKALTNKKGDNDTQEYRNKLKGAAEEVLLIKFADILANAKNSVEKYVEIKDEDWFKKSWMPLLDQYQEDLFKRDFKKYPETSSAFVKEIKKTIDELVKLQRSEYI